MRRLVYCLGVIVLFGLARIPVERGLMRDLHAARFLEYQVNLSVRAQAGQMGFIAALSGYRAVVADFLWIDAYTAWTRTEWGRMKFLFDVVTQLQPRATTFWDQASWHMAWNASVAARENRHEPRETLRIKAQQEYFRLGESYLLEGIKYNPNQAVLFERLGYLYADKWHDNCAAAHWYAEAAKRPDAMGYVRRRAAYLLAACPGHEREAYEMLLGLYHKSENERLPTLLKQLDTLQKQLNIPAAEQIDITEDLKAGTPR